MRCLINIGKKKNPFEKSKDKKLSLCNVCGNELLKTSKAGDFKCSVCGEEH